MVEAEERRARKEFDRLFDLLHDRFIDLATIVDPDNTHFSTQDFINRFNGFIEAMGQALGAAEKTPSYEDDDMVFDVKYAMDDLIEKRIAQLSDIPQEVITYFNQKASLLRASNLNPFSSLQTRLAEESHTAMTQSAAASGWQELERDADEFKNNYPQRWNRLTSAIDEDRIYQGLENTNLREHQPLLSVVDSTIDWDVFKDPDGEPLSDIVALKPLLVETSRKVSHLPGSSEESLTNEEIKKLESALDKLAAERYLQQRNEPVVAEILLLEETIRRIIHESRVISFDREDEKRRFLLPSTSDIHPDIYGEMMLFLSDVGLSNLNEVEALGLLVANADKRKGVLSAEDIKKLEGIRDKMYKLQIRYIRFRTDSPFPLDKDTRDRLDLLQDSIQTYIDTIDFIIKTTGKPKTEKQRAAEEESAMDNVRIIHAELRTKFNVRIPELENITPENSQTFIKEFVIAVMNLYLGQIDLNTASGKAFPVVSGDTDLWNGEFFEASTEADLTLEYYLDHFPYEKLSDHLQPGTPEYQRYASQIKDLFKYRFLAITNMQGKANRLRPYWEELQNKETQFFYIDAVKKAINEGGYASWDLGPFHKRIFDDDPILEQIFGREDEAWRLGEHVNYFMNRVEEHVRAAGVNTFMPIITEGEKIGAIYDEAVAAMPAEYRDHESVMIVCWVIALWNLQHTYKLIAFDNSALDSKAARVFNNRSGLVDHKKGYAVKILAGDGETGDRETVTIATMVDHAAIDMDSFIHVLVNLPEEAFEDVEWSKYKKDYPQDAQYLVIKSYADRGDTPQDLKKAYEEAVTSRYRIVSIKPEYTTYGAGMGRPIAIPKAYFTYSASEGNPNLIPLSLTQVRSALIDTSRVEWASLTAQHQPLYRDAMSELAKVYSGFADPAGEWKFPNVMEGSLDYKISKKMLRFPLGRKFELALEGVEGSMGDAESISSSFAQIVESLVSIEELTQDDLSLRAKEKGGAGFGFVEAVQYIGKYCFGKMIEAGPGFPREVAGNTRWDQGMLTAELFSEIYRTSSEVNILELDAELREEGLDSSSRKNDLAAAMKTSIIPGVRDAIDALYKGYEEKAGIDDPKARKTSFERRKNQAERTFIVAVFWICVRAWLEKYTFRRVEEGKDVVISTDAEEDYKALKTVSGAEPLDPAHRKLIKAAIIAELNYFRSPTFHGDKDYPLMQSVLFDEDDVEGLFESLGLQGTRESFIVDRFWYKEKYPHLSEEKKKEK